MNLPEWLLAAAGVPAVGVCSTWAVKAGGRWLNRAIRASLEDAVAEMVEPRLDKINTNVSGIRLSNYRDHVAVATRLEMLEQRVAGIEARLPTPKEDA